MFWYEDERHRRMINTYRERKVIRPRECVGDLLIWYRWVLLYHYNHLSDCKHDYSFFHQMRMVLVVLYTNHSEYNRDNIYLHDFLKEFLFLLPILE